MGTEPLTDAMLAEWESLAERATEKPHIVARNDNYDARLFLIARTAVLTLAAEVRRLRGMVERAVVELARDGHCPGLITRTSPCSGGRGCLPRSVNLRHCWRIRLEKSNEEAKP